VWADGSWNPAVWGTTGEDAVVRGGGRYVYVRHTPPEDPERSPLEGFTLSDESLLSPHEIAARAASRLENKPPEDIRAIDVSPILDSIRLPKRQSTVYAPAEEDRAAVEDDTALRLLLLLH
jgi:hypothetical protein